MNFDYSVIYQPLLDLLEIYKNIMLSCLAEWLPILLPITGAITTIFLVINIVESYIKKSIQEDEEYYMDTEPEFEYDEYDLENYASFILDSYKSEIDDYSEDIESRFDSEFDDFSYFMITEDEPIEEIVNDTIADFDFSEFEDFIPSNNGFLDDDTNSEGIL